MIDRRRNELVRRSRNVLVPRGEGSMSTPIYLARGGTKLSNVYLKDQSHDGYGARLKWLVSTCVVAAVGVFSIGAALYGSLDVEDGSGILTSSERALRAAMQPMPVAKQITGGNEFASHKTDRLPMNSGGRSTKYIIHDRSEKRENGRSKVFIKPYARVVARLASSVESSDLVPAFNPFLLYANTKPVGQNQNGTAKHDATRRIAVSVLELAGGILPSDDGQVLDDQEVAALVDEVGQVYEGARLMRASYTPHQANDTHRDAHTKTGATADGVEDAPSPFTTILAKNQFESQPGALEEGQELRVVTVAKGDTLVGLLRRAGAESWQARAYVEAVKDALSTTKVALGVGDAIHFTLTPSPTSQYQMEPVRVSLFDGGKRHRVTIMRNDAGDYVATRQLSPAAVALALSKGNEPKRSSLYNSFYDSALLQKLPPDMIMRILRVHAYQTDFKHRVRPGDGFELFFEIDSDGDGVDGKPGELLFTSITVGGEKRDFYRFRSPDGVIDFFDEKGDNAKKFLMRKPVKSSGVRLTSGFGYRIHPVYKRRKMHTGTDWAARRGTPILAAGNGIVEAAGRKGGYGNYVRIRHANGYKTAYAHMRRVGKGVRTGVKVRQGQVIGFVGSSGISSGPHLHYEVLVNNRHVNPMRIHVPAGRRLEGKLLLEFQKERKRIDELMNRSPVHTRMAQANRR